MTLGLMAINLASCTIQTNAPAEKPSVKKEKKIIKNEDNETQATSEIDEDGKLVITIENPSAEESQPKREKRNGRALLVEVELDEEEEPTDGGRTKVKKQVSPPEAETEDLEDEDLDLEEETDEDIDLEEETDEELEELEDESDFITEDGTYLSVINYDGDGSINEFGHGQYYYAQIEDDVLIVKGSLEKEFGSGDFIEEDTHKFKLADDYELVALIQGLDYEVSVEEFNERYAGPALIITVKDGLVTRIENHP